MGGVVSVTATRIQDFEGTPTFSSIGGGAGAGKELVTFFQGAASGSRKVTSSTTAGFLATGLTTNSIRSNVRNALGAPTSPIILNQRRYTDEITSATFPHGYTMLIKVYLSDGQDLSSSGLRTRFDDGTVNSWSELPICDDGTIPHRYVTPYPPTESWLIRAYFMGNFIDPNTPGAPIFLLPYETAIGSSSKIATALTGIGPVAGVTSGAAKSENLFIDSIDVSMGLFLVGGTQSPDDPANFQEFVTFDEETIANRYGHVITKQGVLYVLGRLHIGRSGRDASPQNSSEATYFTDSNKVLVFPDHQAHPWFSGIEIDLDAAATDITFTNCTMKSQATAVRTIGYKPVNVNGTTDVITIVGDMPVNLEAGDIVENQRNDGDTDVIGLETTYDTVGSPLTGPQERFVYASALTASTLKVYDIMNISTGLWTDALNDTGSARKNLTAGTVSPEETHYLRKWNDNRPDLFVTQTVSPSGSFAVNGGTYENWKVWELTDRCSVNDTIFIGLTRMEQNGATISGCVFIDPYIVTHPDQTWPHANTDRHALLIADDISKVSNNIFNFLNTDGNDGHAIEITQTGTYTFTGNTFPGGWGADESSTAMIYNNSGGAVTINVTDGDSPTVRNGTGASTTVNSNVSVTLTNLKPGTEVRVFNAESVTSPINITEIDGIEDTAASPTSFTFSAPAGTVVDIVVHNIQYVLPPNNRIKDFTVPTTATSFPVSQIPDRNFWNP